MKPNNNLLKTYDFTVSSSNEIFSLLENLTLLKQNHIVIHITSASHETDLSINIQNELKNSLPHAKTYLLTNTDEKNVKLCVYTLQSEEQAQDFNDKILTKLYQDNTTHEKSIIEYRNKLFNRYFVDHLTNLPNMYQLRKDLESNEEYSLIICNIDNLQIINNFYGFFISDYVIEEIGRYLKENIPYHKVYRLTGDEFAFVINKNMYFYDLKNHLTFLYNNIKDMCINYQKIKIYIDITLASSVHTDNTNIFSKVSMALLHAKQTNAPIWIYEDKMNFEYDYERNIYLSELIREAVNNSRIIPYYQAIVDTKTKEIKKYECLARLIDRDGRILSPLDFIPITKTIKSYAKVTKLIIEKSFEAFENIDYEFTINLAIEDIINHEIFTFIMTTLRTSTVSNKVTFEILESDAIEDFRKVGKFIKEVKRYGAKIAIDDFGDGYSNFSYLTKINVDFLKIDGSLIKNIDKDKNSYLVVESIVNFANKLGIETIAEFVHSSDVMDKVKELGIHFSQGYYIDKPSLFTQPKNQLSK